MNRQIVAKGVWVLACVFMLVFGMSAVVRAQSSDLSADTLQMVQARCSNSQFALQQIEKRDAVSRINRGRDYDQMLRQVSAFNSRLAYNKISTPDLLQITSDIQGAVDVFRANYDTYDNDLSDAVKIDCKQKPADYYNTIIKAREDRGAVGDQVDKINDLMNQYRSAIVSYKDKVQ